MRSVPEHFEHFRLRDYTNCPLQFVPRLAAKNTLGPPLRGAYALHQMKKTGTRQQTCRKEEEQQEYISKEYVFSDQMECWGQWLGSLRCSRYIITSTWDLGSMHTGLLRIYESIQSNLLSWQHNIIRPLGPLVSKPRFGLIRHLCILIQIGKVRFKASKF